MRQPNLKSTELSNAGNTFNDLNQNFAKGNNFKIIFKKMSSDPYVTFLV